MIIRANKNKDNPYVVINKNFVNDENLSYKAIGILTYIMSKPDGWETRVTDLVKRHTDGETAVKSGVKELIKHGYITRIRTVGSDGKIIYWRLDTYETPELNPYLPLPKGQTFITETIDPEVGEPEVGFPHVDNDPPSKYLYIVNNETTCASAKEKSFVKTKQQPDEEENSVEEHNEEMNVEEVDQHLQNDTGEEWEKNKDEVWESLPSSHSLSKEDTSNNKQSNNTPVLHEEGKEVETKKTNDWARGYRLMDKVSPLVRRVSYLVAYETNWEPEGITVQNWVRQINDLWAAASQKEHILIDGLRAGEKARLESSLSFSGPRSYTSFVRQALKLHKDRLQQTKLVRSNQNARVMGEAKQGLLATDEGQEIFTRPDGTQVIRRSGKKRKR